MRGGVSAVGLTGHEGTSGSVTAASSHLETQSSEVPWDVPLQNQGPLNLKRPEGRPPWAGDFPKTSSRTSLPTAEAVGGHVDPPWAPQNSFSFKQAEPAASGTLVWTSAPFSLCLLTRRARSLIQKTGCFLQTHASSSSGPWSQPAL